MIDGRFDFETADRDYEAAFRTAGFGEVGDDTAVVGMRIGNSAVSGALVSALDDWAGCTTGARRDWVLEVARKADPDPVRDRLRDTKTWNDGETLARLAETQLAELSPRLMVLVGARLLILGGDAEPLLKKAQERSPTDFWIYYALAGVFSKKRSPRRPWDTIEPHWHFVRELPLLTSISAKLCTTWVVWMRPSPNTTRPSSWIAMIQ
jgi:hypothetical protein